MKPNLKLKAAILEVVDNQLRDNTPPEARETLERLVADGYSVEEARKLMGAVVSTEIFNILKNQETFDEERYIKALHELPKMPWE